MDKVQQVKQFYENVIRNMQAREQPHHSVKNIVKESENTQLKIRVSVLEEMLLEQQKQQGVLLNVLENRK